MPQPRTLTDRLRSHFSALTTALGELGVRLGLHPDLITLVGLLVVGVAAILAAQGQFFVAGLVFALGVPLDIMDGAVARALGRTSSFGALWDSTLDRYTDGFILAGLAYYCSLTGRQGDLLLSLAALMGAYGVSYVRARAEGLGLECKVGWFSRVERTLVLILLLLTGWLTPGLWILAIGNNLSTAQRIWHVYRLTRGVGGA